jgi:hypothetical protein
MRVEDRIDAMLDHAIEMTFPASDPFTIYFPEVEPGKRASECDKPTCQAVGLAASRDAAPGS